MLQRSARPLTTALAAALPLPGQLLPVPACQRLVSSASSSRQQLQLRPTPTSSEPVKQATVQDFVTASSLPPVSPPSTVPPEFTSSPPRPPATPQLDHAAPLPVLEPEPVIREVAAPVERIRRPVGAFRGGIIGFLLGTTLVGSYGYFQLLDDYSKASRELLGSVEELRGSTEQMATHFSRISHLEETTTSLASTSATKLELDSLRAEYRKLLEAEHLDHLNTKAHLWSLEQDLHKLSQRGTSVRI
ncbi:hypothetical protein JCM11641_006522 [Rhodosporidiobolus odoratus]